MAKAFEFKCEKCAHKMNIETGEIPAGRRCPKCRGNMWHNRPATPVGRAQMLMPVDEYIRMSPNLKFGCYEFWHW